MSRTVFFAPTWWLSEPIKMIHVTFDPRSLDDKALMSFERWQRRAEDAQRKLLSEIQAGLEPRLDPKLWMDLKPLLRTIFRGKCAYCESNVMATGSGDIEMYRPKSIYPHLAYEWHNLLFSCAICNQRFKMDLFPLEGEKGEPLSGGRGAKVRPRRGEYRLDISQERPLLLHPYFDQPEEHISFTEHDGVFATGLSERGRVSIDVYGLNRADLAERRAKTWMNTRAMLQITLLKAVEKNALEEMTGYVKRAISDGAEYAGAMRQLCRAWIDQLTSGSKTPASLRPIYSTLKKTTIQISPDRQEEATREEEREREQLRTYSVEDDAPEAVEKFNFAAKRIDRVEVQNLRAIPHLDITFPAIAERESWIMLIGENGVGKSTILQGVALALMGQQRANQYGLDASRFVRRGEEDGFVSVHINAVGPVTLRFEKGSGQFRVDPPDPKVPLLAYGPTRLLPSETEHTPLDDRNIRTDNLFRPTVPLSDAESWLAATWKESREVFDDVGRALCRLLSISERTPPRLKGGRVEVRMPDGWHRISDLSAGYRSVLALVVDIAIGTSGKRRRVEDAVGIVLLDEIEVHLHPTWKIMIVERLRDVFPQLSFLATTHDPLCLKGLYDREIVALRREASGSVSFAADLPSVDSLKADEILTSKELFELPSSRNHISPVTIARYSALLNKKAPSAGERRELARLRRTISEMLAGALTPMQREVERVVASVMKELRAGNGGGRLRRDVVAEIRRQMSEIGGEG